MNHILTKDMGMQLRTKTYYYLGTTETNMNEEYNTYEDAKEAAQSYCQEYEINSCLLGTSDVFFPIIDVDFILNNHAEDMHEGFLGIFDHLDRTKLADLESEMQRAFRYFMEENDLTSYFEYVKILERIERK